MEEVERELRKCRTFSAVIHGKANLRNACRIIGELDDVSSVQYLPGRGELLVQLFNCRGSFVARTVDQPPTNRVDYYPGLQRDEEAEDIMEVQQVHKVLLHIFCILTQSENKY
jgi:hypothetical protein